MARVFGYGGLANTNGARSLSGKEESVAVSGSSRISIGMSVGIHGIVLVLGRAIMELGRWW